MSRRCAVAAGFVAVVAGAVAPALLGGASGVALAACVPGEEADVYTTVCTPFMVPNSPSPFSTIPGNPDIPAIDGIPCVGASAGACIGLAENAEAEGPRAVPRSTISASP